MKDCQENCDVCWDLNNVYLVCAGCAPKPGDFSNLSPEEFVGKFVKLCFETENGNSEHMWVKTIKVNPEDPKSLIGELDNIPFEAVHYQYGQEVRFGPRDVEAII